MKSFGSCLRQRNTISSPVCQRASRRQQQKSRAQNTGHENLDNGTSRIKQTGNALSRHPLYKDSGRQKKENESGDPRCTPKPFWSAARIAAFTFFGLPYGA